MKTFRTIGRRVRVRGFSLLELMLVLAILGILMSVVAINVLSSGRRAKERATRASMATIQTALTNYNLNHSAYPPTLELLKTTKELDPTKPLKDAWKHDFVYSVQTNNPDRPFVLASPGDNGSMGDEDDIDVWTMNEKNN